MRVGPFATQQDILTVSPELNLTEAARLMRASGKGKVNSYERT